jgi:two-component system, chemotaxis family, protein-glutamate methylesterase/glutaminase
MRDSRKKDKSSPHVLVVDGLVIQRTVLKRSLLGINDEITVTTTPTAKIALSHLQRKPADLIIMGPGLGAEEVEELVSTARINFPKIVILDEMDLSLAVSQSGVAKNLNGALDPKTLESHYRKALIPHLRLVYSRRSSQILRHKKEIPSRYEVSKNPVPNQGKLRCPKNPRLLLIGVSTGGPNALKEVLPLLNTSFRCPIVVVQHISGHFCEILVKRMDELCSLSVVMGLKGAELRAGTVYFAPGDGHTVLTKKLGGAVVFDSISESRSNIPRPSVDVFLKSLFEIGYHRVVTVILTGMGSDGLEGVRLLRAKGSYSIAQDEASSLVWSMPRSIIEAGESDEVLPLDRVADRLNRLLS